MGRAGVVCTFSAGAVTTGSGRRRTTGEGSPPSARERDEDLSDISTGLAGLAAFLWVPLGVVGTGGAGLMEWGGLPPVPFLLPFEDPVAILEIDCFDRRCRDAEIPTTCSRGRSGDAIFVRQARTHLYPDRVPTCGSLRPPRFLFFHVEVLETPFPILEQQKVEDLFPSLPARHRIRGSAKTPKENVLLVITF
jgi:hypothetical protein